MRRWLLRVALALTFAVALPSAQSEAPSLAQVLRAAGAYVAGFERNTALVAEETYSQQVTLNRRTLRSDLLFIQDDAFGWIEYRDVAAPDGIPVRDRQERLLTLFTKPYPDRLNEFIAEPKHPEA